MDQGSGREIRQLSTGLPDDPAPFGAGGRPWSGGNSFGGERRRRSVAGAQCERTGDDGCTDPPRGRVDGLSAPRSSTRSPTYVAFSRARQQATGYTPDKTALITALPDTNRPRQAALDFLTPSRARRLRWARQVVARANELIAPFLPESLRAVTLTPPTPAPAITPVEEHLATTSSRRRTRQSAQTAARQTMRMGI